MSSKQVSPKFCPVCGISLQHNRQNQSFCNNRDCPSFGVIINLRIEQTEVKLDVNQADNEALSLSYRQLLCLLDSIAATKNPPVDLFGDIQRVSERYINSVTEALKLKEEVISNLPDCPAKAEALEALDKLTQILLDKQTCALLINTVSTEAVINAYTRLAFKEELLSKNKRINDLLRTIKAVEG